MAMSSYDGLPQLACQRQSKSKAKSKTAAASKPKEKTFFEKFKASVTGPPTAAAQQAAKDFHANIGKSEGAADQKIKDAMNAGIGSLGGATADSKMYADNLKRYNDYLKSQGQPVGGPMGGKGALTVGPQRPATPEITPEMREAALGYVRVSAGRWSGSLLHGCSSQR